MRRFVKKKGARFDVRVTFPIFRYSGTPSTHRKSYSDPIFSHESNVRLFLHHGDLTDTSNLTRIVQQVQPDEIYNLAAQSHVAVSFEEPEYTADADALGVLRLLEMRSGKRPDRRLPSTIPGTEPTSRLASSE